MAKKALTVLEGEMNLMVKSFINFVGQYGVGEEEGYGDEIEGEDDKNDGLNALVNYPSYFGFRIFNGSWDLIKI